MSPQYSTMSEHYFNLTGMSIGQRFIGCPKCYHQMPTDVQVCVLECPVCQGRMTDFCVTEEDFKCYAAN